MNITQYSLFHLSTWWRSRLLTPHLWMTSPFCSAPRQAPSFTHSESEPHGPSMISPAYLTATSPRRLPLHRWHRSWQPFRHASPPRPRWPTLPVCSSSGVAFPSSFLPLYIKLNMVVNLHDQNTGLHLLTPEKIPCDKFVLDIIL
jgi:hypothetical protein